MSRPTQATIDLQALRDNFALAQSLAADSQTMPMVKANAYGHGMVEVAQALAEIAPALESPVLKKHWNCATPVSASLSCCSKARLAPMKSIPRPLKASG